METRARVASVIFGWRREGETMVPARQQKWLPGWPENAWTSRQKTMPGAAAEVDPAAGGRPWPASCWRWRRGTEETEQEAVTREASELWHWSPEVSLNREEEGALGKSQT